MDLPLVLARRKDGSLVYRIPIWFRIVMALIFAAVGAAIFVGGSAPGTIGWIVLIVLLLALLYRETWIFDPAKKEISHRFGLWILSKKVVIAMGDISCFRLIPWVRGSLPGSEAEKTENRLTLEASRGKQIGGEDSGKRKAAPFRKAYLTLACETPEKSFTINMVPARGGMALRASADKIATACDKPLEEG
ncbi:MAG: hypothetical protein M0001_14465 [Treponema sp.]|nr:hypothetical protein [Treponema sp.]